MLVSVRVVGPGGMTLTGKLARVYVPNTSVFTERLGRLSFLGQSDEKVHFAC
jgi:hypothetical protein